MNAGADIRATRLIAVAPLFLEVWAVRRGIAGARRGADAGVRVVRSGMGPGAARRLAARLRAHPAASIAIAGLAGAVDPALEPGDVVVATELRGPGGRVRRLDCGDLAIAVSALGLRVHEAAIAGVDHVVRGAEREALAAQGVGAVDMESYWLAEAAGIRPLACLRVIVDGPGRELVSPALIARGGRALAILSRAAAVLPGWAEGRIARGARAA